MRHQPIEQIVEHATAIEAAPVLTRRERLLRWAEVLRRQEWLMLQPLRFVEFYGPNERARLRGEQTPLALAYADPVLRGAGLAGDTLGDIQAFFGLSDREAHFLLCDCHWNGEMTARATARRIRALAHPNPFLRFWMELVAD